MGAKKSDVTIRQVIDLLIAVLPIAVVLGIQYRDEIKRAQLRVQQYMAKGKASYDDALRQVQKEISLMEHGEGADDAG